MVKSVDHALLVLFELANQSESSLTLSDLAQRRKLPKANVLRFLNTLESHGLIARNKDRSVTLGFEVLTLARAFQRHFPIGALALPHLRILRDETGETTALYIRLGHERACIEQVESSAELKYTVEVGRRYPITQGAAGKVLTAFMSEESRQQLFRAAAAQIAAQYETSAKFDRLLDEVRENGYALSIEETLPGAAAVAAPVRDRSGAITGAVTIAGPASRLPKARLQQLSGRVIETADGLARDIGWMGAASKTTPKKRPATKTPANLKLRRRST